MGTAGGAAVHMLCVLFSYGDCVVLTGLRLRLSVGRCLLWLSGAGGFRGGADLR